LHTLKRRPFTTLKAVEEEKKTKQQKQLRLGIGGKDGWMNGRNEITKREKKRKQ
jgi:hypothetical protein